MITVHFVSTDAHGARREMSLQTRPGRSLMEAASEQGIEGIAADCGGLLTCATCHVMISAPWETQLPPASEDEQAMLDFTAVPRTPASRLSCQIQLTASLDGLTVELPTTQY
jgi:ferredoxin, 2Fe-2S